MDQFLDFLFTITPTLHVLAAFLFVLKVIIVFRNKGFDLPAVIISFFRVYSDSDKYMTNNKARQQYMIINNYINYYIYVWALITLIVFIIFKTPY